MTPNKKGFVCMVINLIHAGRERNGNFILSKMVPFALSKSSRKTRKTLGEEYLC